MLCDENSKYFHLSLISENKRAALNSLTTSSSSNDIHAAFDPLDWTPDLIAAFERFIYTNGIQYAYCEGGTNQV